MSELKDIYIIGSGGFGRETVETIRDINRITPTFNVKGFIDDDDSKWGDAYNDTEVLGGIEYLIEICETAEPEAAKPSCVISIADGNVKERISQKLDGLVEWANIIHPTVVKWAGATMGAGNVFQPFVFIGPNAKIGSHILVNVKSNIGHDVKVDDYTSVMCFCDITGNVHLEKKVFAGSRVSVIPGRVVGEGAKLGAGAVIIKDVKPGATMHGHMATEVPSKSK